MKTQYSRDRVSGKTGIPCPAGCGNEIVYNGNYFCDNFEECGWALYAAGEGTRADEEFGQELLAGLEANRRGEYFKQSRKWQLHKNGHVRRRRLK